MRRMSKWSVQVEFTGAKGSLPAPDSARAGKPPMAPDLQSQIGQTTSPRAASAGSRFLFHATCLSCLVAPLSSPQNPRNRYSLYIYRSMDRTQCGASSVDKTCPAMRRPRGEDSPAHGVDRHWIGLPRFARRGPWTNRRPRQIAPTRRPAQAFRAHLRFTMVGNRTSNCVTSNGYWAWTEPAGCTTRQAPSVSLLGWIPPMPDRPRGIPQGSAIGTLAGPMGVRRPGADGRC